MLKQWIRKTIIGVLCIGTIPLGAQVTTGNKAPNFTLSDAKGQSHQLSDFKGKIVVLEWINYDCPFVKKHYNTGHMQHLQRTFTEQGIIWLSINSSAPGKQGHFDPITLAKRMEKTKVNPSAYLLDNDGKVGRMYNAKTTPHMYIINKKGTLVYQGAIDDDPGVWGSDPYRSKNFVRIVLDAIMHGRPSPVKETPAYGCSVKY